jgi:hypothetical protein
MASGVVRAGLEPATNGLRIAESQQRVYVPVFRCGPSSFSTQHASPLAPSPRSSPRLNKARPAASVE